eukprot:TRINITY_DN7060_c0_g1_i2.p2 TRINITY_DN7060_c0_g1~~TRINITY_DN7060_c0_g1_i2.p2  ORF type:complete len:164 (-),score=22.76 TRINITY_DN7060_c0_g1_i2:104-595(-)
MALRYCSKNFLSTYGQAFNFSKTGVYAVMERLYSTTFDDKCKYMTSHEWAAPSGDSAVVGISDFAQGELGEVVYVEQPAVGSTVTKGEQFGVVESVKAASDVYSPISGEVIEVNPKLGDEPGLVNSAPFTEGWIIKVKMSNKAELDSLMDVEAYKTHCESEAH